MDTFSSSSSSSSNYLIFFFVLFFLQLCSSSSAPPAVPMCTVEDPNPEFYMPHPHPDVVMRTTQHDDFTTTPVTNPVTTPATTQPPLITVPSPVDDPLTNIPSIPPAAGLDPFSNTPAVTGSSTPGQSWCVARGGLPESVIQVALDYACGIGAADCSSIQQGQSCYNPNTLQNHASVAFNSYYQRNPVVTSCDFGGAATITNLNPSSGSCIFTTWSSASPATVSPTTTTPVTYGAAPLGFGTPPTVSNPAAGAGGFGEIPAPTTDTASSSSSSSSLKPFIRCIAVAVSIISYSSTRAFWNV